MRYNQIKKATQTHTHFTHTSWTEAWLISDVRIDRDKDMREGFNNTV